jgi:nitrite reductase (NADH) large subunit
MATSSSQAWRCSVCGYIHRGDAPPEECPVCGAPASDFEGYTEPGPPTAAPAAVRRWRCTVCNYQHEGPEPPEDCPLCGAARERFEPAAEEAPAAAAGRAVRVVIVGGGIAGVSAAEALRKAAPEAAITLLSKETEPPYYRLNLTRYLAGEVTRAELPLHPAGWYDEQRIELRGGAEVARLDLEGRAVLLRGGERLPYEKLILTSGAHPFVPPVVGASREGVISLRTAADADRILEAARAGARCVCIGGGLLGLETAGGLARQGADVTVLESFGHLMPSQLDPRAGALLARRLAEIGVQLRASVHAKELVGDERVAGVALEEGGTVPADLVILATGVRPNSYLARQAGLNVKKGVVVDNLLRTSHPDVLAAGDAAEHLGLLYGNWYVAQYQGSIAGMNAAGLGVEFGGVPRSHTLKVLGLDTFSIGQFVPQDGSYRAFAEEADGRYFSLVFRDGLLVGANLVGSAALTGVVKKAIESRTDFSGLLAKRPSAGEVAGYLSGSRSSRGPGGGA